MAVRDIFANDLTAAGKKAAALSTGGSQVLVVKWNFELLAADDDGSVYRLARLPANAVPIIGQAYCDTITSGTDFDLGLYKPGIGGAVVDKDLLGDGIDFSTAVYTSPKNPLVSLGGADPTGSFGKTLWELLGLTKPARSEYDLAWTGNTVGSAALTLSGWLMFAISGN
jgi:hypothetical protein